MKAKRKRSKEKNTDKDKGFEDVVSYVSTEAVRGVFAIFCIAVAGFLILAQLGGGGAIGGTLYEWLSWLLGVGYLLLPLSLVLLATLIFRDIVDMIFALDNREDALALIEYYNKYWMGIIGTRGAIGKKTMNSSTTFNDLFATDDGIEEYHVDDSGLDETNLDSLESSV